MLSIQLVIAQVVAVAYLAYQYFTGIRMAPAPYFAPGTSNASTVRVISRLGSFGWAKI